MCLVAPLSLRSLLICLIKYALLLTYSSSHATGITAGLLGLFVFSYFVKMKDDNAKWWLLLISILNIFSIKFEPLLQFLGYNYQLQEMSPPPVSVALDEDFVGPDNSIISIDYSRHPLKKHLESSIRRTPFVLFGPSNIGKTTFIQSWVQELQNAGVYAVLISLRSRSYDIDQYIYSELAPQPNIPHPVSIQPPNLLERVKQLVSLRATKNSPIYIFVDDAQHLQKESTCLGIFLDYILKGQLRVIFITSDDRDNPEFLTFSGYTNRYKSTRFMQSSELVIEALKKTGCSDDDARLILESVGLFMGDIVKVIKSVKAENISVPMAINNFIRMMSLKLRHAVYTISQCDDRFQNMDSVAVQKEIYDYLSTLSDEPNADLPGLQEHISDPNMRRRLLFATNRLVDANIISSFNADCFFWRRKGYATALRTLLLSHRPEK